MALTEQQRQDASAEFQRDESQDRMSISGFKADVKILMDSLDDYLESNQLLINQAIPLPQRSRFTTRQKARALIYVVRKRYLGA